MQLKHIALAVIAATSLSAQAAGLNLGNYTLSGDYALALSAGGGSISGLEASAVTYARDRGTLFFVGDEGSGVFEISKTGQTVGSMAFNWSGTGSSKQDTEGLAYIGNGQLVVTEERLYDAYKFSFVNGGTANLASNGVSISNDSVGNNGLEGIAYDARNGSFLTVKQANPQDIRSGTLSFAAGLGGVANTSTLFDPGLLGVSSLSDIAALSAVDSFVGTAYADNLLILSLDSQKLLEVTRSGQILSSLDLTTIAPHNAIEGVTVDEKGTIYLVAEQAQDGISLDPYSRLYVLTAPVPEPETYAMFLAGLGLLGAAVRRKQQS